MPNDDDFDPKDIPTPEYVDLDAMAFEEEWRAWIDDPPVDWRPPPNATRILTQTLDMREAGQFVMRFDAWMGEAGIHVHARVVMLSVAPAYATDRFFALRREPWYAFWKKREYVLVDFQEKVIDRKILSKSIVGSFVLPWSIWSHMESDRLDPDFPKKPNGKGGKPDPKNTWRQDPDDTLP